MGCLGAGAATRSLSRLWFQTYKVRDVKRIDIAVGKDGAIRPSGIVNFFRLGRNIPCNGPGWESRQMTACSLIANWLSGLASIWDVSTVRSRVPHRSSSRLS